MIQSNNYCKVYLQNTIGDFDDLPEPPKFIKDYVNKKIKSPQECLDNLEEVLQTQCSEGNYNYNEYNFGLANGLLLAEGIIKDKDPIYINKPKKFIEEKEYNINLANKLLIVFGTLMISIAGFNLIMSFIN